MWPAPSPFKKMCLLFSLSLSLSLSLSVLHVPRAVSHFKVRRVALHHPNIVLSIARHRQLLSCLREIFILGSTFTRLHSLSPCLTAKGCCSRSGYCHHIIQEALAINAIKSLQLQPAATPAFHHGFLIHSCSCLLFNWVWHHCNFIKWAASHEDHSEHKENCP